MKKIKSLSSIQKQACLFGIIIDPITYIVVSLIVLLRNVSMVNTIDASEAILHTFIGLTLMLLFRITLQVYKANWKKFPMNTVYRMFIADIITCIIHYVLEQLTSISNIPFMHIIAISLIAFVIQIISRMLFYSRYYNGNAISKVYLSSPTMYSEEQRYIAEAFERNWVAPLGFNCDGFENEMVKYLDEDLHAFATSSGTGAIHLACKLANIKPGDHVLCSDLTFAATVNPVTYEGGIPVFVDSEYDTWNMSPEALEEGFKKYPECKVVVLVHLYGTPAKVDEILKICKKHKAILVEDAAEALGASYKGHKCGSFGSYNILSFNGNKIITTSGGGMLLTKTKKDRDRALFLGTQAKIGDAIWYEHKEIGYNYRMSNVVAGIGRGQLKHLNEHVSKKEEIYNTYKKGFKGLPCMMNPYLEDSKPNYWLSCLLIDKDHLSKHVRKASDYSYIHEAGKTCPDEIFDTLRKNNIETRPIWKPMHMQPVYKNNDFIKNPEFDTPVSEDIFDRGICLPTDIKMDTQTQLGIIESIKNLLVTDNN